MPGGPPPTAHHLSTPSSTIYTSSLVMQLRVPPHDLTGRTRWPACLGLICIHPSSVSCGEAPATSDESLAASSRVHMRGEPSHPSIHPSIHVSLPLSFHLVIHSHCRLLLLSIRGLAPHSTTTTSSILPLPLPMHPTPKEPTALSTHMFRHPHGQPRVASSIAFVS